MACSDPAEVITFVEPDVVTIRDGDTVESLARHHGVPMDELMAWNGIPPGVPLVAGRTLLVFQLPEDEAVLAAAAGEDAPKASSKPKPKARASTPRTRPSAPVLKIETDVVEIAEAPPPVPGRAIQVDLSGVGRVGDAGVLAAIDGMDMGDDNALADAAANLENRRSTGGGLGLRRNDGLAGGGTAESLDRVADTRVLGSQKNDIWGDNSTIRVPKLAKPAPKRCLSGPTEADLKGDNSIAMARGLTASQVRTGMSRVTRYTLQCFPSGTRGAHTVTVEVTAGCDGTVKDVWLANSGGLPSPITSCITQTIYAASFPAHALPDGALFQYPIQYRF